jgi:hypothetical protein
MHPADYELTREEIRRINKAGIRALVLDLTRVVLRTTPSPQLPMADTLRTVAREIGRFAQERGFDGVLDDILALDEYRVLEELYALLDQKPPPRRRDH